MRAPAFGLRSAFPIACLLSQRRIQTSLNCSRCGRPGPRAGLRLGSRSTPESQPPANRSAAASQLKIVRHSRNYSQRYSRQLLTATQTKAPIQTMRCPGPSTRQPISERYSKERTRRSIQYWPKTSLALPRERRSHPPRARLPSCTPGREAKAQIRRSSPPPSHPRQAGSSPFPKRCPNRGNSHSSRSCHPAEPVPDLAAGGCRAAAVHSTGAAAGTRDRSPGIQSRATSEPGGAAVKSSTNTPQPAPRELAKSQPAPVDVVSAPSRPSACSRALRQSKSRRRTRAPTKLQVMKPDRAWCRQCLCPSDRLRAPWIPFYLPYVHRRHLQFQVPAVDTPPVDTQVRILAACTPDRGEVAFALQLKAASPTADPAPRESLMKSSRTEGPRPLSPPAAPLEAPSPETETDTDTPTDRRQSPSPGPQPATPHTERERHPEVSPSDHIESSAVPPAGKIISHTPEVQMKTASPPEPTAAEPARPTRPQESTRAEAAPETVKGSPVRDMKLELAGGDRRVEVRLSERGGEVKMTVRTPDTHLANALRENLPALSARLAESGFKSDAWHPSASSVSERSHTTDSSANSAFQDANPSPRDQDRQPQQHGGQRQRKNPEEPLPQQQKGRDFAWLMSSLR